MEEIWRDVIGYEGLYKVSNLGNVMSLKRIVNLPNGRKRQVQDRMLSTKEAHGYPRVILSKDNLVEHRRVHQLMAESFLGHDRQNSNLVVDHINNVKNDNRLENLQIITIRLNTTKDRKRKKNLPLGVTITSSGKFRAAYCVNGVNTHIGVFDCPILASLAYKNAIR